jgi:DNA modification methylase
MIELPSTPSAVVVRANALELPLPDESVDLVITSPPYFALRSYRDDGTHYEGQIGSEPTPQAFLEALWAATAEMKRVLKPSGSIWVNLGDKYAGSGGHNNSAIGAKSERGPSSYNKATGGIPAKSLMGLPWRYAIGCIDHLGLILRAEVIWSKPNGLPESVTDRVRRSHEQWFHMTKSPRYFAAVDEVREPHANPEDDRPRTGARALAMTGQSGNSSGLNPLGKLPGSVWTIPSEPLRIPDDVKQSRNLPDHFAAFPSAWPVRIIAGWSPSGICTACGEPRRPVVERTGNVVSSRGDELLGGMANGYGGRSDTERRVRTALGASFPKHEQVMTGRYTCPCDSDGYRTAQGLPLPPTTPAVVLDPFGGTGTVAMVAKQMGRVGISVDLSNDYCRLAEWRCNESDHGEKAIKKAQKKGLLRQPQPEPTKPEPAAPSLADVPLFDEREAA